MKRQQSQEWKSAPRVMARNKRAVVKRGATRKGRTRQLHTGLRQQPRKVNRATWMRLRGKLPLQKASCYMGKISNFH